MNERELNLKTKKALRGDLGAAREVISFLWSYRAVPQARYTAYAIVYQIALNTWGEVARICMECGGRCCREGPPLPIYDFDLEELARRYPWATRAVERIGSSYVLRRPCPLQEGWRCRVHDAKPYACLSYPFMVEEVAIPSMAKQLSAESPEVETASNCPAGAKVKELVDSVRFKLREELRREPTPLELLMEVVKLLKP